MRIRFLWVLVFAGACDELGNDATAPGGSGVVRATESVTVDASGGTLSSEGVEITIPANALETPAEMRLVFRDAPRDLPESLQLFQPGSVELDIEPSDTELRLPAVFRLNVPEISKALEGLAPNEGILSGLMRRDTEIGQDPVWISEPSQVDKKDNKVVGYIARGGEMVAAIPRLKKEDGSFKKRSGSETKPPKTWGPLLSAGPGGVIHSGATPEDVEDMWGYTRRRAPIYTMSCGLLSCFRDFMSDKDLKEIATMASRRPDKASQMRFACDLVQHNLSFDKGNVCRHHAIALQSVLREMGIASSLRCGSVRNSAIGHAWVEVVLGRDRYLLDAYNQTYVHVHDPIAVPDDVGIQAAKDVNPNAEDDWTLDLAACPAGFYPLKSNTCGDESVIEGIHLDANAGSLYRFNSLDFDVHPRVLPLQLWAHLNSYQCGTFCDPAGRTLFRDCWGGPERLPICRQAYQLP